MSTYLVSVLIGRAALSLERPFTYVTEDPTVRPGERVLVSFGSSKETVGFVLEVSEPLKEPLKDYEARTKTKYRPLLRKLDQEPLLTPSLMTLARQVAEYYKCDLVRVLSSFLPPSLKPKDSSRNKPQAKTLPFVRALPYSGTDLSRSEKTLYEKLQKAGKDGLRKSQVTAKKALEGLLLKKAAEVVEVEVSRIPERLVEHLAPFDLLKPQEEVRDRILSEAGPVFLLQGVTGSGKTMVYLSLAKAMLEQGKGILVLVPEIALTDHMADLFAGYFQGAVSILHSSLSEARKYDEYRRIRSGEAKVVLGTRSAVFAPVQNLGLIIIDEEHSTSYKQDTAPCYEAVHVAEMRARLESAKVVLGSATPRLLDRAKADRGLYVFLKLEKPYSDFGPKPYQIVDLNDSANLDPYVSSFYSKPLIREIGENLKRKEQTMILLNRRGYAPLVQCRHCHKTAVCPNCGIPLSYHRKDETLRCHHCGYRISRFSYVCPCGKQDLDTLGYGTERAYEELRMLFPTARIYRLDSDVSSNEVRHQVLEVFSEGDADLLVGTQLIAKGHDFPNVTLAAMLEADYGLRIPSYTASEDTFDLIAQFVGRAGRARKPGRVLLQTYAPENPVLLFGAKQDYEGFYQYEMNERKKYQYPPYTYLTLITVRSTSSLRCSEVAQAVKSYLLQKSDGKRINLYGPSSPYIPHLQGRYYQDILLKYKSWLDVSPILDGIQVLRLANKDAEILVNVDPAGSSVPF